MVQGRSILKLQSPLTMHITDVVASASAMPLVKHALVRRPDSTGCGNDAKSGQDFPVSMEGGIKRTRDVAKVVPDYRHPGSHCMKHHRPGIKVVSADFAVSQIRDGCTVATGGFVGIGFAENIAVAIERRFLGSASPAAAGHPCDLTLVYAGGQGDGHERGLNHFGHAGLLKRVVGGHWGLAPKLQQLAMSNQIEAYNLPQGVISQLFRDIAANRPGQISRIGLGTFVDPRQDGGKINACTHQDLVQLITIDGEEVLFYRTFPVDVGIIRGTTADANGNVTMEKEALTLEVLAIAMAAHNSGGIVIVQVERLAQCGSLSPRQVKIPGILVDYVVVTESPAYHMQTFGEPYDPAYSGEIKVALPLVETTALNARTIIARRAALELTAGDIVDLGIGIPEGVAQVCAQEQILDLITLTAEPGTIGGLPASGVNFGAVTNAHMIIEQPSQFDFYDGGGLDIAVLGLAQADSLGNLNVSRYGSHLAGAGGFINISQSAQKVVFVGTFTAGQLALSITDGRLKIIHEGDIQKFVSTVEQCTFSAAYARMRGQTVLYVTERCVFRLTDAGLELIEIAPGIDLEHDILSQMAFRPAIAPALTLMDARLFDAAPMGLQDALKIAPTPLQA